ncbi:cytochrome c oxidase subunit II [Acidobacterium capsulatum]|uniref:Cytochrome c oxidase subunit 2 n=2 Tax=Acidobacterium TaxID=33973 RepID=C1F1C9_ACIC5|nr:cytochrome c oxidase subunit II [Acidobacterium capsulatum]ACO33686.1 cytochrome c oxidase, subunit II [Acidobacterium capsulatum ATCC 51196]
MFKQISRGLRSILYAAGCAMFLQAGAWAQTITTNTDSFSPASKPAHEIFGLAIFALAITGGIFVVVAAAMFYAVIRYRRRKDDDGSEPPQIFGSVQIEIAWTVIPIIIVVVLFLTSARLIFAIKDAPRPKSALNITVVGHQFWWEIRYPGLGIITANEIHVPVSTKADPQPTYIKLLSADVVHSFWVPQLAGKTDAIPNHVNETWIEPTHTGIYKGQCSQFCGAEHAKMLLRVYVDTPAQFEAWVKQQQQPAVEDPAVAAGREVFMHNACMNCHEIRGTEATGRFGPDLTHVASRDTLASGSVMNNPANLRQWIENPDYFKPGVLMPAMHLSSQQLDQVTAYLDTLH